MPHVAPLEKENAPPEAQPVLSAIEAKFGKSLNLFSTLAHQPDVLEGVTRINEGIQNNLPDKLRELAYLQSSRLNSCGYCAHYHTLAAKKAGVSDEQMEEMEHFAESAAFDDHEKAVLSYATELTATSNVQSNTVAQLKAFLSDKEIVTLAATVALANFTNRVNHGLDIELP